MFKKTFKTLFFNLNGCDPKDDAKEDSNITKDVNESVDKAVNEALEGADLGEACDVMAANLCKDETKNQEPLFCVNKICAVKKSKKGETCGENTDCENNDCDTNTKKCVR